jgi:hypothetical protein
MAGETEDAQEKSSKSFGSGWLWWLGLVLASYVLSTGPVAMMEEKQLIHNNTPLYGFLCILYRPVIWAYLETPLHKPLGIYWHLWTRDAEMDPKIRTSS